MAIINKYTKNGRSFNHIRINHPGSIISWVLKSLEHGQNFSVYEGDINQGNEISRDEKRMQTATEVSIFILPSGGFRRALSLVVSVASTLFPSPKIQDFGGGQNRSPNNKLTDRKNRPRPNQRIPEIVGSVLSVPDAIQREYSIYTNNIEEKYGYYCVGTNQLLIEDLKDGDSLINNTKGASAGIYFPGKSPNNSLPDIEIGTPINRDVVGVYSSNEAIGQTIAAQNESDIDLVFGCTLHPEGYIQHTSNDLAFDEYFNPGDSVYINQVSFLEGIGEESEYVLIGTTTNSVLGVTPSRITFDITGDSSWSLLPPGGAPLGFGTYPFPRIENTEEFIIGPFKNNTIKADQVIVNVYAPNGMYKQGSNDRKKISVSYNVTVETLNDEGIVNSSPISVGASISGRNSNEIGTTTTVNLPAKSFFQVSIKRTTDKIFSGSVLDEIKLKNIYGIYGIGVADFGNVTTIQTKRITSSQTTAIRDPELNCKATELVYEYQGNGVFDAALTPNTKGMQSLMRLALNPYVGRREQSEIDLDLLLQTQIDIESYFGDEAAGQCSYTFDDVNISAQETLTTIANAIFCILWREGRVLKSFFEKPQLFPSMVFTHRSKKPNAETWSLDFPSSKRKDSIEFKYADAQTHKQETLYFPANRTGANPLKVEIPGIKGIQQATWRMMREYNKLLHQNLSVNFTSTAEGRFVSPFNLISVVKGSRVASFDGYIIAVVGLSLTLSQDVVFTDGEDHFILIKRRNGSVESIPAVDIGQARRVDIAYAPQEQIYTGNNELKTEFSFGSESRVNGQLMIPVEIIPTGKDYVNIKAIKYSDIFYQNDSDTI